jgi:hypothetical protein
MDTVTIDRSTIRGAGAGAIEIHGRNSANISFLSVAGVNGAGLCATTGNQRGFLAFVNDDSSSPTVTTFIMRGCSASYAIGTQQFPVIFSGTWAVTRASIRLNELDLAAQLTYNSGTPQLSNAPSFFGTIAEFMNGLPGEGHRYGTAAPSVAGHQGDRATNRTPSEAGTGGSKYIVDGWDNVGSGTWDARRTLTGN